MEDEEDEEDEADPEEPKNGSVPDPKPQPPNSKESEHSEPKSEQPADMQLVGEAALCLPSAASTVVASLIASFCTFLGLLALSFSELEVRLPYLTSLTSSKLLLRVASWGFLFYFPIFVLSAPLVRNYALWALRPSQQLADAWPPEASTNRVGRICRSFRLPFLLHFAWITIHVLLICLPVRNGEDRLGIFPVFVLGNVLGMPSAILLVRTCGPRVNCKSYAFSTGPSCVFLPIFGFAAVVAGYIPLRRLAGMWMGVLMPFILSVYEFMGTLMVARNFTKKFLTKWTVRESYVGTNQGVIVSMTICNLHALAEGARLTLLYVENMENPNVSILIPIVSGVLWNVLMRIGCMDRVLHRMSCERWKPKNSCKLLRESGYCMGYPRFGAIGALLLARLCIGTAVSWEDPKLHLLLGMLLAEVIEDLLSFALWRLNLNVSPPSASLTDSEVDKISWRRLTQRSTKAASILPSPTDDTVASRVPVASDEFLPTVQWKVRVADEFIYGPEDFGQLPFWAHLLPTALAQFHTILALMVFCNGPYILGLCDDLSSTSPQVLWWPMARSRCTG